MEETRVMLMGCLVLGILVGQSTASFPSCYFTCFTFCIITPQTTAFFCNLKCLRDCIIPPSSSTTSTTWPETDHNKLKHTQNFCKLGCATALCSNLSTKEYPHEQKVGRCVDSCSETCSKTN